ncbi:MAG: OmpA family protein [Deltaproteobacteria bacterium]|nr:OmpA family protein [Deltaproteobacteria bacterium]
MTRRFLRPGLGALVAMTMLFGASAAAQQKEWSLQKFRPAIHSLGSFTVEAARVSHELTMNAFLMFNYAAGVLQGANGKDVVDGFGTTDLVASIGFIDHLSFGFDVPVHAPESGTFLDGDDVSQAGLGDIRLSLKATAIKPWRIGPGIGIALDFMLPSGSKGGYGREEGVTLMPKILLDAVTQHVHLMTNIFFLARTEKFKPDQSNVDFDDDLGIGSEAGIATALSIFLGSTDFRMNIEGRFESRLDRFFEPENTQLEFTWGLHWKHSSGFAVGGGASFGALPGYGDPDWRVFLQVGYQPGEYLPMPEKIVDSDGDGILDNVDQCPREPEDMDGWQDTDGCPDVDNDQDGILDANDKCPNEAEDKDGDRDDDGCPDGDRDGDGIGDDFDKCPDKPEDKDGFEDEDGCPDLDNDKDGILDKDDQCPDKAEDFDGDRDEDGCPDGDGDKDGIPDDKDKCPTQPEDIDGFEDEDGCPDPDNDGDGILDKKDKCPLDAEDKDGFQDGDGCPDPDNDRDGIPDEKDKCPDQAEDFDGCQDEDGCPEAGRVCVTKEKIVITEKVFFATGKATIQARSFSLLDEVAKVLNDNKQIKLVEVQGHTDNRGNDDFNLKLSDARARAVYTYLIGKGVDPSRLTAQGYGETRPIGDNNTSIGREANRRVEFVILKQDVPE